MLPCRFNPFGRTMGSVSPQYPESYLVANSGNSNFNGKYDKVGVYNNRPYYRYVYDPTTSSYFALLVFSNNNYWEIGTGYSDGSLIVHGYKNLEEMPDQGAWESTGATVVFPLPVPTVTAIWGER